MTSSCRLAPLAAAVALCFTGTASAATITVNDPTAASLPGSCTIVDAVASINQGSLVATSNCANSGGAFGTADTINFSSNFTITFVTPAGSASSALLLTKPVTIAGNTDGSGKPLVTIQRSNVTGTSNFRLVETNSDIAVSGLVLSNGYAAGGNGGGIDASASANVTLTNSVVSGNKASANGGGIYSNYGLITLTNSAIVGNSATYGGGADSYNNSVAATRSTVSGNAATTGRGGGIYGYTGASAIDTTISGNTSANGGGGLWVSNGNISLTFCTVSCNSAPVGMVGGAGVFFRNTATIASTATMIFNNGPANDVDTSGASTTVMTGDHNLIGTHGALVTVPADTKTCDPNLGPLFDNGGPTQTRPLFAGSCAIDAGPTTTTVVNDQRGLPRNVGGMTDIGAFEKQGPNDPADLIFVNGFEP